VSMFNSRGARCLVVALCATALPSVAIAQDRDWPDVVQPPTYQEATTDPAKASSYDIEPPTPTVTQFTNWVIASHDNADLPFIVIDKIASEVFVHDARGDLVGATPALLGEAFGDDSVPGIGDRELSEIKPEERTTPAGRFVAKFGPSNGQHTVLWVDFTTAISLHPVITNKKREHRMERLLSPTPDDNRITHGCINVPAAFFIQVVWPMFKDTAAVVYILPEAKPLTEVFNSYKPRRARRMNAQAWR
jgi:hypothetical protein